MSQIIKSLTLFFISINVCFGQGGLSFESSAILDKQTTSLLLPKKEQIRVGKEIKLKFNLSLKKSYFIGNILRIIGDEKHKIDLIYYPGKNRSENSLIITFDQKRHLIQIPLSQYGQYVDLSDFEININQSKKTIVVTIGNQKFESSLTEFPYLSNLKLIFGSSEDNENEIIQIPTFTLNNVQISSRKKDYHWPLNEYKGSSANEVHHNKDGSVERPNWLLKDHYHWKKIAEVETAFHPALVYDSLKKEIISIDQKFLNRINIRSQRVVTTEAPIKAIKTGIFEGINLPKEKKYLVFDIRGKSISSLYYGDTVAQRVINNKDMVEYLHPNIFYNDSTNEIKEINGFGMFKFKTDYRKYNRTYGKRELCPLKGDSIAPRNRMSQYKLNNNEYLLYGGIGNENGDQTYGSQFFYDLYKIDTEKDSITKLWEMKPPIKNMSNVGDIYLDKDGKYFYSAVFLNNNHNTTIQLMAINMENGELNPVSDTINLKYRDTQSEIKLFRNPYNHSFYLCYLNGSYLQNTSILMIYELKGPPINSIQRVKLDHLSQAGSDSFNFGYFILIIGILILVYSVSYFYRPKKGKTSKDKKIFDTQKVEEKQEDFIPFYPMEKEKKQDKNALYIFGKFKLYDNENRNISHQVTEKLKQVFLIILFYPFTHHRHITTKELTELLWPDSTKAKSKNNRSVTIRRLRVILEQCEGIQLVFENNAWAFSFDDLFYNEFYHFLEVKEKLYYQNVAIKDYINFYQIVEKGSGLQPMAFEYIDETLSKIKSEILETLIYSAKRVNDLSFKNQIIDCIFEYDKLDEEALNLKIQTLLLMDKKVQAHQEFTKFSNYHLKFFGEPYTKSFDEIVD
ncbi:hypothetical protein KMW28_00250 [Flammeovirga yaeyamensis]|uniref:Uncharacterized protein n=1 Tax=Flammeovirga yaeyamensis TaxID=367791 RepID=A0AAX1N3M9_9BACT|nr:hypothetical protein [Flammeovirga yaeyamensis]MBB3700627.1 DNA-binding SARP family transcriptional activator [Flammeovirga yaeyamensis]NMF37743.1 hypothetical protein [Flammeovirga yaeyamensis]QWG02052.1 hypothetical protein KMW28_00250 [Flammeovirga yaeyamensis]